MTIDTTRLRDRTHSLQGSHEMPSSTASRSRSPSPASEPDIFSISSSLVPEQTLKRAGNSTLNFDGLLSTPLILHEDLQEGCGGQLWPAGIALARYLLTYHRKSLRRASIIEIGAGGGLVGLAVALGCEIPRQVVLTDQQPMLNLMEKNIQLNKLDTQVCARVYDWGSKPVPTFPTTSGHADIVLAADCVYFEPAFPLLLQTLDDLIGPTTVCYFCFKKRRKADMRFIRDMMKKFEVADTNYDRRETNRREGIFLYQVRRRTCGAPGNNEA